MRQFQSKVTSLISAAKQQITTTVAKTIQQDAFIGTFLPYHNLQVTKFLAQGSFANVYETSDPQFLVKKQFAQSPEQFQAAIAEYELQRAFEHPNVVQVYALIVDNAIMQNTSQLPYRGPANVVYVMERCEQQLVGLKELPEAQITAYFAQIAAAFAKIHSLGFINRDAKLENMLLRNGQVKICDFGSATNLHHTGMELIGNASLRNALAAEVENATTPQYRPPELVNLLSKFDVTGKVDVFAIGVAVFRLMYGRFPFPEGEVLANFNARFEFPDEAVEHLGPYAERRNVMRYSAALKGVVRACLQKDPVDRPSCVELLGMLQGGQYVQNGVVQEIQGGQNANLGVQGSGAGCQQNLFDFAPVQSPQHVQNHNFAPQNPASAPQQSLFDFAPVQSPQHVQNHNFAPQNPASAPQQSLFDFAPVQSPQHVQNHNFAPQNPTSAPQQSLFDFAPVQSPQHVQNHNLTPQNPASAPPQNLIDFAPAMPQQSHSALPNSPSEISETLKLQHDLYAELAPAPTPTALAGQFPPKTKVIPDYESAYQDILDKFVSKIDFRPLLPEFPAQNFVQLLKRHVSLPFNVENFTPKLITLRYQELALTSLVCVQKELDLKSVVQGAQTLVITAKTKQEQMIAKEILILTAVVDSLQKCESGLSIKTLQSLTNDLASLHTLKSSPLKNKSVGFIFSFVSKKAASYCKKLLDQGEVEARDCYAELIKDFKGFQGITGCTFNLCESLELYVE
ncbi:Kinase, NAK [Spironucleus salmonicida]|uniref:non-specific serine/threonine protein kinase n=1 Tax=Spironucleus salmonicida TaxID=348837 RepID=V6LKR1_9EUKA|nr:Kinase, NAK [Spironucleus salmonicida]KAH0570956.1 Kinase, NAK [Spironucleus salmonicida]|eukprot:EST44321.1 Kinase, NAK [Spironucleus salmonicida]